MVGNLANKYPPCAAGTWAWGNGMIGGKMIFGSRYDEGVLKETFEKAFELGFTLWDTAEIYGMGASEKILSECIAQKRQQGERVLVSTKYMPRNNKYKKGDARAALEGSLKRLGIDRADIYWLHVPVRLEEYMEEYAQLADEGKIVEIGVSNCNLEQVQLADKLLRRKGLRLGAVQNHFSLLRRDKEQREIIRWCNENEVTYFSYMVMEQGALCGGYDEKHGFPPFSLRWLAMGKSKFRKIAPLIAYIRELGEKYSVPCGQIPVAWAIARGTIPIIGLTKPRYAEQLVSGCELHLDEKEIERLESLAERSGVVCKGVWEPKTVFGRR